MTVATANHPPATAEPKSARFRLIVSSLVVAAILFGGYHELVKKLPSKYTIGGGAGSANEQNLMSAQQYLYLPVTPTVVVTGSSISARLRGLPGGWYNLSLAGCSTFTPLDIVLHKAALSGQAPKYILIETNVLNMDPDVRLLSSLFYPGMEQARRKLPELRETDKPHHVLLRVLNGDTQSKSKPTTTASSLPPDQPAWSDDELTQQIARRMQGLADPLPPEQLKHIVELLTIDVTALRKRGSTVVFYEVPQYAPAMAQPALASLRQAVHTAFPEQSNIWIPPADPSEYVETDVIHLAPRSATKYSNIVKGFVAGLDMGSH